VQPLRCPHLHLNDVVLRQDAADKKEYDIAQQKFNHSRLLPAFVVNEPEHEKRYDEQPKQIEKDFHYSSFLASQRNAAICWNAASLRVAFASSCRVVVMSPLYRIQRFGQWHDGVLAFGHSSTGYTGYYRA
jgi:hypothetical protein